MPDSLRPVPAASCLSLVAHRRDGSTTESEGNSLPLSFLRVINIVVIRQFDQTSQLVSTFRIVYFATRDETEALHFHPIVDERIIAQALFFAFVGARRMLNAASSYRLKISRDKKIITRGILSFSTNI